jgi:hypothetical protein
MAVYFVRMRPSSIMNHSLKTFRGVGDPGRRMKTAKANATCASTSTTGVRRATTIDRLKFWRPPMQSFPPGVCPGLAGGRNCPAGRRGAVFDPPASGMGQRDRTAVGGNGVEVTVDDPDQRIASSVQG